MTKKRGFTLVEILVVLAITTLVLAMVGGLLIFMADTSGKLIHKSEELMLVQSIETYLRGVLEYKDDDGKVYEPRSISVYSGSDNNLNTFTLTAFYDGASPKETIIIFDKQSKKIIYKSGTSDETGKVIFKDTGLEDFDIYYIDEYGNRTDNADDSSKKYFVRCKLVFTPTGGSTQGSYTYDFIIGIKKP